MRRTLSNALSSRLPVSLNLISTDARVVQYINAATERLLSLGHWYGAIQKYTINVTSQLLTLPPQFATIEQVAVCKSPIPLRNQWFEFNSMGVGIINDPTSAAPQSCASQALFRGNFPTFIDITSGHRARVQCDVAADVGATVLLLGYDSNGNWVRTNPGSVWQDGETVTLAQTPGTLSATSWSRITDIQKPVTKGQIWLYDWDGAANTQIGNFQYWETSPAYPRYLLPTLASTATQVDLIGKLAFIPVVNPTDYLIISNLEALRLGCMAVKREEENLFADAALLMYGKKDSAGRVLADGAVTILDNELRHFMGDGTVPSLQVVGSNLGDACSVEALI